MKRLLLVALLLPAALLAKSDSPGAQLIAADDALAIAIQRDGSWTAFRAFALPQTEIFGPRRVKALAIGANTPDPPYTLVSKPEQAWISCDGTAGATYGSTSIPAYKFKGWYQTIWAKVANGSYRMLLKLPTSVPGKLFSKPGRRGMRAACTGKPSLPVTAPAVGTDFKVGASQDQTLIWSSSVSDKGEVRLVVSLWDGAKHVPVLEGVEPAREPR